MRSIQVNRGPALAPPGYRLYPVVGAVVCGGISALCWRALLTPGLIVRTGGYDRLAWWICFAITCLFGLLAVWAAVTLLFAGNRVPRFRVDAEGVALWHRDAHGEFPWAHVVAVGVGYERKPSITLGVVRPRQDEAIEVYLADPDPLARFPEIGFMAVAEEPPRPGLPGRRVRLVIPISGLEQRLAADVERHAPGRWLGAYQRRWNAVPGV